MPQTLLSTFFKITPLIAEKNKNLPTMLAEIQNNVPDKKRSYSQMNNESSSSSTMQISKAKQIIEYKKSFHLKQVRSFLKNNSSKQSADRWLHWKGFLFTATNNFKEYTVVTTVAVTCFKSGKHYEAGAKVAEGSVDDDYALTHIKVEADFQRQKIGSELIRFMSKACGKYKRHSELRDRFIVYNGQDHNSRYRLTVDGGKLITYCREQEILKDTQVIIASVPSPSRTSSF